MGKNVKCLCAHWHTTYTSRRAKPSVACGTGAVGGGRRLEEMGAREQLGCQTGARCTIWYGPPIFSQMFSALLSPLLNTKHRTARLAKPCVSPPPRAECWTWYAIPNSAAFDFANRVTLLRFWDLVRRHTDWQKICPVTHSHYSLPCNGGVIQQACPESKKFVTLTLTGKKHWHRVLSTKKRVIWQEKYPETDDTLAHCLMSFRCTLHYTKALKVILLQPVLELASSEHLFRWFSFTLREWGPRSSRSTQHASLSASPKTCFIFLSINTKSIFTHSGWAVVRNSGILPLALMP